MRCRASATVFIWTMYFAVSVTKGSRQMSLHYLQSSACVDSFTDVTCVRHRKIAIRRIVYGAKRTECPAKTPSCCIQKREDCFIYHDAAILSMNTYCSGHRECAASTRVTAGLSTKACSHPPNYETILYDCIHDSDIVEFGTNSQHTGNRVYISNARYPSRIPRGNITHTCHVTTPHPTNISLRSIDMVFTGRGYQPRVCDQSLSVASEDGRSATYTCTDRKYYGFTQIYKQFGMAWDISLTVHASKDSGRVWLTLSASNNVPLSVTCASPGHYAVTSSNVTTVPSDNLVDVPHFSADIGILAGCVAGAVLLVVLVLVIIYWNCQKRNVAPKSKSTTRDGSPVRVYLDTNSHFPDVCRIHEYSAMPVRRGGDNLDNVVTTDNNNDGSDVNFIASPSKSRPTSAKLKKKVSFKDMLAIQDDAQSNSSSSRPNSYISGSSFYTFGKVDDDIDDVTDIQQRELPPPPDWICQNDELRRHSVSSDCGSKRMSNRNIDDFYNNVMNGDAFEDLPQFSLYDDIDGMSLASSYHGDDDVMVIENDLYEPGVFVSQ